MKAVRLNEGRLAPLGSPYILMALWCCVAPLGSPYVLMALLCCVPVLGKGRSSREYENTYYQSVWGSLTRAGQNTAASRSPSQAPPVSASTPPLWPSPHTQKLTYYQVIIQII